VPLRLPVAHLGQFATTIGAVRGFGAAPPPAVVTLPIPYVQQAWTNWCWAACAEMASTNGTRQCALAATLLGNPCPSTAWYDQTVDENGISNVLRNAGSLHAAHVGGTAATTPPLTAQALQTEINQGRPIEIGWRYFNSFGGEVGGHVVLCVGYRQQGGIDYYEVHDPLPQLGGPSRMMIWTDLVAPPGRNPQGTTSWCDAWTPLR
jgi:hypothetical protein